MPILKTSIFFLLAGIALAQVKETTVMSGNAILPSGAMFDFKSMLRPPGKLEGLGVGGIRVDQKRNLIHRFMTDEITRSYFGYDVEVGVPDASHAYLVTFEALSDIAGIHELAGLKSAPMPTFPPPQLMHDGEMIELDLMVSPDGKRRLTDVIAIRVHDARPQAATTSSLPRDFTVDDGPITFDVSRYEIWKQGQEYKGMSGFTGKPGNTLWFAIAGDGRYILSLTPHEGFAKAGTVRDNVVAFGDSGKQYELRFRNPIAGAGKAWNLYVLHDSKYVSGKDASQGAQFGTDRLDSLLAR